MTGYASSTTARRQPFRTSVRKNRRTMPAHLKRRNLLKNLPRVQSGDGWGDAEAEKAERVIKGTLLKYSDWKWTKGKEGIELEEGISLVALATAAGWVKWYEGKPVEYVMREPG